MHFFKICSAQYLPKKGFIKDSSEKWAEVAKKIGFTDEQSNAAISVMKFIQENDNVDSDEVDDYMEWQQSMVNFFILRTFSTI